MNDNLTYSDPWYETMNFFLKKKKVYLFIYFIYMQKIQLRIDNTL